MWYTLGKKIVEWRFYNIVILFILTCFFGYKASKITLSYEFTKSIPTDSKVYKDFVSFQKQFAGEGELIVLGIETNKFYTINNFNAIQRLTKNLKSLPSVREITSIPDAIQINKDTINFKFVSSKIFREPFNSQSEIDSQKAVFENIPFYKNVLYNPLTKAHLIVITINKDSANSKARTEIVKNINAHIAQYEKEANIKTYISGLPFIRTVIGDRIKSEMNYFLAGSLLLSAIILLIFFRSFSAMLMSLVVVAMGVIWCFGLMVLLGYKLTLLSALIAPLVVVIGVPNCIYFLNKYHSTYLVKNDKSFALYTMVGKMGIVTLFCNIAAAIGFAVFALTESQLLKEFGIVAGIIILALFFISLLFIPSVLSYLKAPTASQMKYLHNSFLQKFLHSIQTLVLQKRKLIIGVTIVVVTLSIIGIFKLKKEAFIVDDLPKNDIIYTNLKWFEENFGGVMPLEIIIDSKKRKGLQRTIAPIEKMEELNSYISSNPHAAKPISFIDGLKLARQAFYDGDSNSFTIPTGLAELSLMSSYMQPSTSTSDKKGFDKVLKNFIDSNNQVARISVNMKDIGSVELPKLITDFKQKSSALFDTTKYNITYTGASVTFLEGSNFIINGLKESIAYAFLLIALCMLYLFKSFKILLYSIIPNVIPLVVTAGVMGWVGISIKPSTVLVFSVALGIVIDITIRFLINYKQEFEHYNKDVNATLTNTIKHTGISIIYTSLVLIVGFVIFCFSKFGGTQALGWLTSLTLLTGTFTNLILLPALMSTTKKAANEI